MIDKLVELERSIDHGDNETNDRCASHPKEKLSVFCADCAELICHHCALWDHKHEGHIFKDLAQVYEQRVEDIRSHLQELGARFASSCF